MAEKKPELEVTDEEKKLLGEGQEVQMLVDSPGWKTAKEKLYNKLIVLDSLSSLPDMEPSAKLHEMNVRRGVVSIIHEWIREIEGLKTQHESHVDSLVKARMEGKEEIIKRF